MSIHRLLDDIQIPHMARVRQRFSDQKLDCVETEIAQQFQAPWVKEAVTRCPRIGITVGSRGIANLKEAVRSVCRQIRELGSTPYLLPSMGSHGAATAEGQRHVLHELGITEEYTNAGILSGMEVALLGQVEGIQVYYDQIALGLDGVIVLNRIKAHTDITGEIESGLQKMIAIGLGNHLGAVETHAFGLDKAVPRIQAIAGYALNHANILFGIGMIENAYDETHSIHFLPKDQILSQEPRLLEESKELLPFFRFNDLDVLVVQRIGKNISGDGMDPNIIGRGMIGYKNKNIRINQIAVLDLTEETKGSAIGLGLADVTTKRVYEQLDLEAMYINAITAIAVKGAFIPPVMDNDRMAIQLAIKVALSGRSNQGLRLAFIRDTLSMEDILVSAPILDEMRGHQDILVIQEPQPLPFSQEGNLLPVF